LGVSNFYPLGLSLALGAAGSQTAKGSSWAAVGSGSAVLAAPLALGALADAWNLRVALLAIPLGLAILVSILIVRSRKVLESSNR
jgi:hypothetical protein